MALESTQRAGHSSRAAQTGSQRQEERPSADAPTSRGPQHQRGGHDGNDRIERGAQRRGQSARGSGAPRATAVTEVAPLSYRATDIADIQGTGFRSTMVGEAVQIRGIVTGSNPAALGNCGRGPRGGFYVQQGGGGDGYPTRSTAIFVRSKLEPAPGTEVIVRGVVAELASRGSERATLTSIHKVPEDGIEIVATDQPLPPAIPIRGFVGTRVEVARQAEALESMRALFTGGVLTSRASLFGDVSALPDERIDNEPLVRTAAGGVHRNTPGAWHKIVGMRVPPWVQQPETVVANTGDRLGKVVGIYTERNDKYQIYAEHELSIERGAEPREVVTRFHTTDETLTIGNYNVLNGDAHVEAAERVRTPKFDIDDDIGDGRFAAHAQRIVQSLGEPPILALQEVQDNDGAEITDQLAADRTYEALIAAIAQAGGQRSYAYAEVAPREGNVDAEGKTGVGNGGQPGGNIRNGLLYDPQVVDVQDIKELGAFPGSRAPLAVKLQRHGGDAFWMVINHWASRRNSGSEYGEAEPVQGGHDTRMAQAEAVAAFVREQMAADPQAKIWVSGDFNEFEDGEPVKHLERAGLVRITADDAYDYVHHGVSQSLGHVLVSPALAQGGAQAEFLNNNADRSTLASDHDPSVSALPIGGTRRAQ